MGTTLFVRTQSGLTATDAGRTTISRAGEIERRIAGLSDTISDGFSNPKGTVSIRGNNWVISRLTEFGLKNFLDTHPGISLRTNNTFSQKPLRTVAGVSIWFERRPVGMEFGVKLGTIPYGVYQSINNRSNDDDWVSFLDEEAPRLAPNRTSDQLRGSKSRIRFTSTDAGLLRTAIAEGIGKGLLPMCLAEEDEQLQRVGDGPPELRRDLHLHLHPDTVQLASVQAVIRWLRSVFLDAFAPCEAS